MQPEINLFPSCSKGTVLTSIVTGYNQAIGTLRSITNTPTLPLSRIIYQYFPATEPVLDKTPEDFANDSYPYKTYIDLVIAVKIMRSEKVKRLLVRLYRPEKQKNPSLKQAAQDFIELTGIACGIPEINHPVFKKLKQALKKGGALRKPSANTFSPSIPRDTVLLNFFSSFIAPQFITLPIINEGVKALAISGISLFSPTLASAIKYIDTFNPVKFLLPDGNTHEYSRRLRREAIMANHLRQQGRKNSSKLSAADQRSPGNAVTPDAPLLGVTTAVALAARGPGNAAGITAVAAALVTGSYLAYRVFPYLVSENKIITEEDVPVKNEIIEAQHDVFYGPLPLSLNLTNKTILENSTCINTISIVRGLLNSAQTGIRLVDEFSQYILDEHCDLNIKHTESLLRQMGITYLSPYDRDEINAILIDIFSVLLTPVGRNNILNLNALVFSVGKMVIKLWRENASGLEDNTISYALNKLRLHISRVLVNTLGLIDESKTRRFANYIITLSAPDFIQFENNGLGQEKIISKKLNNYWVCMGEEYPGNKALRFEDFSRALRKGERLVHFLIRGRFYKDIFSQDPDGERFENYTRSVNKETMEYHELDVALERQLFLTLNDIIIYRFSHLGVDVTQPVDFDRATFKIHRHPARHLDYPYLQNCKNLLCAVRSFPDGIKVVYDSMPNSIPGPLRNHKYDGTTVFTLKPYPKRLELQGEYQDISTEIEEEHIELYRQVITRSFSLITENDKIFINDPNVRLSVINLDNHRLQRIRFMLTHKAFKLIPEIAQRMSYNVRPHCQTGVLFYAKHSHSQETRIFQLNIEASRIQLQLPITRLAVNNTHDITSLGDKFLNQHYVFMDGLLFWDPCDDIIAPTASWLDPPEKVWDFISQYYKYYRAKWCTYSRPDHYIVAFFTEKELGTSDVAIPLIIDLAVENRKNLLELQKEKINTATETESERDEKRGLLGIISEYLPLKECYELGKDVFYNREDTIYTSASIDWLRVGICALDAPFPPGVTKSLKALGNGVRTLYIQRMQKKHKLRILNEKITLALTMPHTSQQDPLAIFEPARKSLENEINDLTLSLKQTQEKVANTLLQLASIPSKTMIPESNLSPDRSAPLAILPGIFGRLKKHARALYSDMGELPFQRWNAPEWENKYNIENFAVPMPARVNITCFSDGSQSKNITLNVFDIHRKSPPLYVEMFFSALRNPNAQEIIETAMDGGWRISNDYDQMAMFCFRSFTFPVRLFVNRILELNSYYNLNQHRTDIDADFFYDHFQKNISDNKTLSIPDVVLTAEQNLLIELAMNVINKTFKSNIQAFEANYLFMLDDSLMRKGTDSLLRLIGEGEDARAEKTLTQQDIHYEMGRFTLYLTRSSAQEKFHLAVINFLIDFIRQAIEQNPAAINLFSASIEIFNSRCNEYRLIHPTAEVPSLAEFIRTRFRIMKRIEVIYEIFARVEYSAKVLADYPVEEWSGAKVQADWLAALQEYMSPDMCFQDMRPFLADVTKRLLADWQKALRNATLARETQIIDADEVSSEFIVLVRNAFRESCLIHHHLLFCQYYLVDEGCWFTFLTNDFISETHLRSRRQVYSEHPFEPLPVVHDEELIDSFNAQTKPLLSALNQNGTEIYQTTLNNVVQNFIFFSLLPFHDRLYGHLLTIPAEEQITPNDIASMIEKLIDEDGELQSAEILVLQRYLPAGTLIDNDRLLKLCSDTLQLADPAIPDLYLYVFNQLQKVMNLPWITLEQIADERFLNQQSINFIQDYQNIRPDKQGRIIQATTRFIKASVRHHLAFASVLSNIDTGLQKLVINDAPAQQLCIGAIIAHQLKADTLSHEHLLKLYSAAMHDAGFVPVIRFPQLALLSMYGNHYAGDALHSLARCLSHAAEGQTLVLACVTGSQKLAREMAEFSFDSATANAHQRLLTLALTTLRDLHKLIAHTLPAQFDKELRQARDRGELRFSWYLTPGQDVTVAGIGFTTINQNDGLLLPLGLPLPAIGPMRQTPVSRNAEGLTRVCFGDKRKASMSFTFYELTAESRTYPANETISTTLASLVESSLRRQFQQLAQAKNATEFAAQHNQTGEWLARHIPFYAAKRSIAEEVQSERIIQLAAHPDIIKWKNRNLHKAANQSSVDFVGQAISGVMGKFTDWPMIAKALRTRWTTDETYSPDALPATGFMGIWWDPISYVCYLGFSVENERSLYASLAGNRGGLYLLTNNYTHSRIWQSLSLRTELQQEYQALRNGTLTAQIFFEHHVRAAWQQQHATSCEHWQLMPRQTASALIRHGVLYPVSYLQPETRQNDTTLKLSPYTLQFHTGDLIFIFSDNSYRDVNYRFLDSQGKLQVFPIGQLNWPRQIRSAHGASSEALFGSTMESFLAQEQRQKLPDFLPLLTRQEQQQIKATLVNGLDAQREYIHSISHATSGIPFRFEFSLDGLIELDQALKRIGSSLNTEIHRHGMNERPYAALDHETCNIFSWRNADLYDVVKCNQTLEALHKKNETLTRLVFILQNHIVLQGQPEISTYGWVEQGSKILSHAITAIEWFKSRRTRPVDTDEEQTRLHQNCLTLNNFFSYYDEQPFVTPEIFMDEWQYRLDQSWLPRDYQAWMRTFAQLRMLAAAIPDARRASDNFLRLNENNWQGQKLHTYAGQLQQRINGTRNYWQQVHMPESLLLIRPETSPLDISLSSTKHGLPVRLIVSARVGDVTTAGKAQPLRLNPEHHTDLLLANSAPATTTNSTVRLAGLHSEPQLVHEFAAWAKHRLAGPIFMCELSGAGFLFRLQNRIHQVIATESQGWNTAEQKFYAATETTHFLKMIDFGGAERFRYLDFFKNLFASEILVMRLIMPDPEMVFGLMCDYVNGQHPERANEDFSMAWFMFKETFDITAAGEDQRPPYLIGI
ncbi:MAG: hypothetical protein PW844_08235 [Pantoea sp.]|uniref:hypothetical protein n=1 Tax=Pantoea sp. TaxID=69393 RepID=UPI00239DE86F|nr:hypothetical protein [Pantoea sp.]MDE1186452.1 hypothetical protein [Pantoea sp.]